MCMQVNDTIVYDLASGKVTEHIKFDLGQVAMVVGGKNRGRVGTVISREKHKGSFDIGIVRDAAGVEFATRSVTSPVVALLEGAASLGVCCSGVLHAHAADCWADV